MEQTIKKQKRISLGLLIALIITGVALIVMTVLFSISSNNNMMAKTTLENIYQRNFNELVDSVNNTEIKLSKVAVTNQDNYAKKLLDEISKNVNDASNSISSLPLSINGISQTTKFINQVSGYTKTLSNKVSNGEPITDEERKTLKELSSSFSELKNNLNRISKQIYDGNIYNQSINLNGDFNDFTRNIQSIKSNDVDYPAMIYDGPFSDSQLSTQIKNINSNFVSQQQAKDILLKVYPNISKDNVKYMGQTNGKFKTFDYEASVDDDDIYAQITISGGHLLTISAQDESDEQNYTIAQAIEIATNFAKTAGVDDVTCVWNDIVGGNAYINLAPVQKDIILYPDLVKVKVDLSSGEVIGYEACSYYTNHTDRDLQLPQFLSLEDVKQKIDDSHTILSTKLALAPLDFGLEKICWEVKTSYENSTFFYYINVETGEIENILKVIETENGNKLM